MKRFCLILILGFMQLAYALPQRVAATTKPKLVTCQGPIQMQRIDRKVLDKGNAVVRFYLMGAYTIKNAQVATRFSKMSAQSIDSAESHARRRAIASGKVRADLFDFGNNGACQVSFGYQGEAISRNQALPSWGILMLGCGMYGSMSNLKCTAK